MCHITAIYFYSCAIFFTTGIVNYTVNLNDTSYSEIKCMIQIYINIREHVQY
jgi:hypothetical protein